MLFRRYGVCQVSSLDEMMDTLELLDNVPRAFGPRLSVLMESGGVRSLFADIAAKTGLAFTDFSPATQETLREILDDGLEPVNPLDAFGLGRDVPWRVRRLSGSNGPGSRNRSARAFGRARARFQPSADVRGRRAQGQTPARSPAGGGGELGRGGRRNAHERASHGRNPVLMGTRSALRAIQHLVDLSAPPVHGGPCRRGRPAPERLAALRRMVAGAAGPLGEHESKQLLATYGIPTTAEEIAQTPAETHAAARRIGFPVALKTAAAGILHKSDEGGVRLGLGGAQSLDDAYTELSERFGPRVLVQRQVNAGTELILGMKRDPQLGALVLFGIGGVLVEVYHDVVSVLAPFSEAEARALPDRLQGRAILDGVRGAPPVDIDALVDVLVRFSTLAGDFPDLVAEIDVNPLIATGNALVVPGKAE